MSKQIMPEMGIPAGEFLNEILEQAKQCPTGQTLEEDGVAPVDIMDLLEDVVPYINRKACLNQAQAAEARADILNRYPYGYGHDDLNPNANEDGEENNKMRQYLILLLNTARHDCEDCLRGKCKMRDPNSRLEDVEKRAKVFKGHKK